MPERILETPEWWYRASTSQLYNPYRYCNLVPWYKQSYACIFIASTSAVEYLKRLYTYLLNVWEGRIVCFFRPTWDSRPERRSTSGVIMSHTFWQPFYNYCQIISWYQKSSNCCIHFVRSVDLGIKAGQSVDFWGENVERQSSHRPLVSGLGRFVTKLAPHKAPKLIVRRQLDLWWNGRSPPCGWVYAHSKVDESRATRPERQLKKSPSIQVMRGAPCISPHGKTACGSPQGNP